MIDYKKAQKMFTKHKGALTRAKKKGPEAIIKVCDAFFEDFEDNDLPLPDRWHIWQRAKEDAENNLRRANASW